MSFCSFNSFFLSSKTIFMVLPLRWHFPYLLSAVSLVMMQPKYLICFTFSNLLFSVPIFSATDISSSLSFSPCLFPYRIFFLRFGQHHHIICVLYVVVPPASHCEVTNILDYILEKPLRLNRLGDMHY